MRSWRHAIIRSMSGDSVRGLFAAACLLAAACTGDSGGPTAPSPGTTPSVSVTYPADHGTIYIGNQVQFQATVSSSGTQASANAVWESDAPPVATVSSSGLVTAVSAGEATISAEVPAGGRGSLRIRVFPEFHGHWEGDLFLRRSVDSPEGERDCTSVCGEIPLAADFTQDDATVTGAVTSTIRQYEWTVLSGRISIDGTLSLTFDEFVSPFDGLRARLMSWESRADTPDHMTGTTAVHWFTDDPSGNLAAEGCLAADYKTRECSGWRR